MQKILFEMLAAVISAIGFTLLFNSHTRHLLTAGLGACLCWGIFLGADHFVHNIFLASAAASAVSALYAEVAARLRKAPAIVFFIPCVIPLIPGGKLYHMMSYAVQQEKLLAEQYKLETVEYALGIVVGASLVWGLLNIVRSIYRLRRGQRCC